MNGITLVRNLFVQFGYIGDAYKNQSSKIITDLIFLILVLNPF
jgi:hypothetical protein